MRFGDGLKRRLKRLYLRAVGLFEISLRMRRTAVAVRDLISASARRFDNSGEYLLKTARHREAYIKVSIYFAVLKAENAADAGEISEVFVRKIDSECFTEIFALRLTQKIKCIGIGCGNKTVLYEVIRDYEALCKENQTLKDRIGLLTQAVEQYQGMESAMEKSLDTAKKNAEDMKRNAELEAQTIISRAKLDAVRLAKQIDEEHIKKHREMLAMKSEIEAYKTRIKTACTNLLKAVDEIQ